MKNFPFYLISFFIVVFDQITKILIRIRFLSGSYVEDIPVFGDYVKISHVENSGAAFGMRLTNPTINKIVLNSVTFIATFFIIYLLIKAENKLQRISFSLILGGAIGNMIDRIFRGSVTDFINCDFPDFIAQLWSHNRFPVFNIADSAISIAFCLLVIDYFITIKKRNSMETV